MLAASTLLFACDPIEDKDGIGGSISEADLSCVTLVAKPIEGITNGNYFTFNSDGVGCLSQWDFGTGTVVGTSGTIQMILKGERVITFTGRCADGKILKKEFPVVIDTLLNVAPEWELITGKDGVKSWCWAPASSGNCWGNSGFHSGPTGGFWWGRTSATIAEDAENSIENETAYEAANLDANSYMIFDIAGAKMSTYKGDGTLLKSGTFSFEIGKSMYHDKMIAAGVEDAIYGNMSFKGVTILQGISQNEGHKEINQFDLELLSEDEMWLSHKTETGNEGTWGAWGCEGWYWHFVEKK